MDDCVKTLLKNLVRRFRRRKTLEQLPKRHEKYDSARATKELRISKNSEWVILKFSWFGGQRNLNLSSRLVFVLCSCDVVVLVYRRVLTFYEKYWPEEAIVFKPDPVDSFLAAKCPSKCGKVQICDHIWHARHDIQNILLNLKLETSTITVVV